MAQLAAGIVELIPVTCILKLLFIIIIYTHILPQYTIQLRRGFEPGVVLDNIMGP
jgi:hypothetical protein